MPDYTGQRYSAQGSGVEAIPMPVPEGVTEGEPYQAKPEGMYSSGVDASVCGPPDAPPHGYQGGPPQQYNFSGSDYGPPPGPYQEYPPVQPPAQMPGPSGMFGPPGPGPVPGPPDFHGGRPPFHGMGPRLMDRPPCPPGPPPMPPHPNLPPPSHGYPRGEYGGPQGMPPRPLPPMGGFNQPDYPPPQPAFNDQHNQGFPPAPIALSALPPPPPPQHDSHKQLERTDIQVVPKGGKSALLPITTIDMDNPSDIESVDMDLNSSDAEGSQPGRAVLDTAAGQGEEAHGDRVAFSMKTAPKKSFLSALTAFADKDDGIPKMTALSDILPTASGTSTGTTAALSQAAAGTGSATGFQTPTNKFTAPVGTSIAAAGSGIQGMPQSKLPPKRRTRFSELFMDDPPAAAHSVQQSHTPSTVNEPFQTMPGPSGDGRLVPDVPTSDERAHHISTPADVGSIIKPSGDAQQALDKDPEMEETAEDQEDGGKSEHSPEKPARRRSTRLKILEEKKEKEMPTKKEKKPKKDKKKNKATEEGMGATTEVKETEESESKVEAVATEGMTKKEESPLTGASRPEKVKSRWLRWSEAEQNVVKPEPSVPPPASDLASSAVVPPVSNEPEIEEIAFVPPPPPPAISFSLASSGEQSAAALMQKLLSLSRSLPPVEKTDSSSNVVTEVESTEHAEEKTAVEEEKEEVEPPLPEYEDIEDNLQVSER